MSLMNENLSGQMLLAMPGIGDSRFDRSVVYIFEHGPEGAMGFVVNQPAEDVTLNDILESLDLPISDNGDRMKAYLGGPVETGRGFVLHTSDYTASTTSLGNNHRIALTATLEIMEVLGKHGAPDRSLLFLGYSGWDAGQLDAELHENAWLACEADLDLIFSIDPEKKYPAAMARMGIDLGKLSSDQGQA